MNGLASSDPLSTQHRGGGGGSCIPAFSVWAQGQVTSPACPCMGDGPSVQVRLDGSVLEGGSCGEEGHSLQQPPALPESVLDSSGLPEVPHYLSRQGKCRLGEGHLRIFMNPSNVNELERNSYWLSGLQRSTQNGEF